MTDDAELLRCYAEEKSEEAFAELVRRHLGLVYYAALRQCGGDAHRAEDVAQMVFTDLARKARSVARRPALAGWLHTSTRYAAAQAVRGEVRRQAREREAHAMNEILAKANGDDTAAAEWERMRPVIDDALHALGERDREAVLARFFEGKAFAEIGAAAGDGRRGADAVERALEKLRGLLVQRGVNSTAAALGIALANQAGAAVPVGLAASVTGAALAGATAGGVGVGAWVALFTMSKIKTGIVGAIVVAAVVPAAMEVRANRVLTGEVAALRADSGDVVALRKENRQLDGAIAGATASRPNAEELARLRARVAVLQKRPVGVTDATLKPAATWRNLGWATPEAALETSMWAGEVGNTEEFVVHTRWIGEARDRAQVAFAQLPEMIRARYGSADRLLGEFSFGSRGQENDAEMSRNYGKVTAFQVLDVTEDPRREGMRVRRWEQTAAGYEREMASTLSLVDGQFVFGQNRWNEKMWQDIVGQIDPVTGAFRPRKVIPLDPATGRPIQPQR